MRCESYKRQNGRLRRKWFVTILCVGLILQGMGTMAFADDPKDADLCEHHPAHTADCGYKESLPGIPCEHQHIDSCYDTKCIHKHDENCGGMKDASSCTHQCSEES